MKTVRNSLKKKFNKVTNKVIAGTAAVSTAVSTMAVSAFAEDPAASSSLATALATIQPSVVLDGFYQVLPIGLTIALPIVAAKVGLNFFFGMVKGA